MTQIDPDARPGGRAAAHRVDEDVVRLQPPRRFRVTALPAFEAGERVRLVRRPGDGDERGRGPTRTLPARWRDPRRLVPLLLVVGRPGRIAESGGLLGR